MRALHGLRGTPQRGLTPQRCRHPPGWGREPRVYSYIHTPKYKGSTMLLHFISMYVYIYKHAFFVFVYLFILYMYSILIYIYIYGSIR